MAVDFSVVYIKIKVINDLSLRISLEDHDLTVVQRCRTNVVITIMFPETLATIV